MYKIEEFVGTAAELEKFLNEMQVIKHFNLSHIVSRPAKTFVGPGCSVDRTVYTLVFSGNDEEKKRQIYLEYAKENLCKDCLTCCRLRVLFVEEIKKDVMRGNTMKKHIIELIKLYE